MGNTISIPYNLRDENQLSLLEVIDNKLRAQLQEENEKKQSFRNLLSKKRTSVFPETVLFEKTPQ
jgi:hypothetical protein